MNLLKNLPLAVLLQEMRTAERLVVAIPDRPYEEAAVKRATLEAVHAERLDELARRSDLIEIARQQPANHG